MLFVLTAMFAGLGITYVMVRRKRKAATK